MKKKICIILLGFLLVPSLVLGQATTRPISNPQLQMFSSRVQSLGGTNPVIAGDIGGAFINPAVVGSNKVMPFSVSHQKLLGYFDCELINISCPIDVPIEAGSNSVSQRFVFGLALIKLTP